MDTVFQQDASLSAGREAAGSPGEETARSSAAASFSPFSAHTACIHRHLVFLLKTSSFSHMGIIHKLGRKMSSYWKKSLFVKGRSG